MSKQVSYWGSKLQVIVRISVHMELTQPPVYLKLKTNFTNFIKKRSLYIKLC